MIKKVCDHKKKNQGCKHPAGGSKCRCSVKDGVCSPPARVRVTLGITLENVDSSDFARFLKKNGGRMPVQGFVR